jgi:hypothetical protein
MGKDLVSSCRNVAATYNTNPFSCLDMSVMSVSPELWTVPLEKD